METSLKNNKTLKNINNKLLEIRNDRGILGNCLLSPLSKITNPENSPQFKLIKDHNSNRVKHLLFHNTIRDPLYNDLLTFRDTGKEFQLQGDLFKIDNKQKLKC